MSRTDWSWLGPMAGVFVFIILMMLVAFRRAYKIRDRQIDLSDEHERLMIYAQARLAAQQAQSRASKAETPEEQAELLRMAIDHWRRAIRNRRPEDQEAYQDITAQLAMVEEDLAAIAPDEHADAAQEES